MEDVSLQINKIIERNKQVEKNKQWETSWTRRSLISIITFFSAFLFLKIVNIEPAFFGALVPVGGFLLSQISMNSVRKIWEQYES